MALQAGWISTIAPLLQLDPQTAQAAEVRQRLEQVVQACDPLRDPYLFLTQCCYTFDEVAPEGQRTKRIPHKEYIKNFVETWLAELRIVEVKSRRMIVSWTCTGLETWQCMTSPGFVAYIISADQTRSEKFLGRSKFILEHLPPEPEFPTVHWSARKGVSGDPMVIYFEDTGSRIEAVSSEPNKIRQEGASYIRCEEIQIWQWPEQSWRALMPTILGGGRIVVVGTPAAGTFFEKLVFDRMGVVAGGLANQVAA